MSVPLDNLYHWVESLLPVPAVLYVFHPHGSKKISDCHRFKKYSIDNIRKLPTIILYDQEPLDWEFYNDPIQYMTWAKEWSAPLLFNRIIQKYTSNFNLKSLILFEGSKIYDQVVLIHSEKNSIDLEKYSENGFICVHYWAHAIIARDWYRFAQSDARLSTNVPPKFKFLIYCRDWGHRREYRLKFLELLIKNNLDLHSLTGVMHTNSENVHFLQHKFSNPNFELMLPELINRISDNVTSSHASADYDYNDFVSTQISVVLETVFDDSRIHLTEKTLRPIACGHPFILAAGPGALEYLRSYGFKTFAPWIDESYDSEPDSFKRLEKIIHTMNQIQNLQGKELEDFLKATKEVADYNKEHFFSTDFFNQVENELKSNLNFALGQVKQQTGKHYLEMLTKLKKFKVASSNGQMQSLVDQELPSRKIYTPMIRQLRRSCQSGQSSQGPNPTS
jgi:hypothetical protein